MSIMHNVRVEVVDVQEFLNSLAVEDSLSDVACSWANVKAIDVACTWQELLPEWKFLHGDDVIDDFEVDDSMTSHVLYAETENSVKEDEYEEDWLWELDDPSTLDDIESDKGCHKRRQLCSILDMESKWGTGQ